MPAMNIILDGDNAWPDLNLNNPHRSPTPPKVHHLGPDAPPIDVAVLASGMTSGRPSVMFRLNLPDGSVVLAETSARLFCIAARAVMAKFPDLFEDPKGAPAGGLNS